MLKNTVILKCKEGCLHPIVAFNLCTECGQDLKDDDTVITGRSVSMLHAIPQVTYLDIILSVKICLQNQSSGTRGGFVL